jgi:hypothetical protein
MSGTPAGADAACEAGECLPQVGRSAAESELVRTQPGVGTDPTARSYGLNRALVQTQPGVGTDPTGHCSVSNEPLLSIELAIAQYPTSRLPGPRLSRRANRPRVGYLDHIPARRTNSRPPDRIAPRLHEQSRMCHAVINCILPQVARRGNLF